MMRRFLHDERGGMTVEFVTALPMILAALVIAFEAGRGLWFHQIVTKSVRDATRFASRYAPLGMACDTLGSNGTFVGDAVGDLPTRPIPTGRKTEIGPDDRVYLGSWTRLVVREAVPGELTP